jgi:hypothetical protein
MERNIKYGIQTCTVGDDNVESTYVKFGDGLTRISAVKWDDELSGIAIFRDELSPEEPFGIYNGEEACKLNKLPDLDKVFIAFDNERSIDVMIAMLRKAKSFL